MFFPYAKPCHVAIEPNPFVLRVAVLNFDGLKPSRGKVDFQDIFVGSELLSNVDAVWDKHVVTFKDSCSIKPDGCKSVQAIKC